MYEVTVVLHGHPDQHAECVQRPKVTPRGVYLDTVHGMKMFFPYKYVVSVHWERGPR